MNYLDAKISVVPRATEHRPVRHITVATALDEIQRGKYASYVERVRAEPDKERRRKIKANGPAYTFSGRFTYVSRDGLLTSTGLICLDYDGLGNVEEARRLLESSPYTLAVFASVSGDLSQGLKALIPVTPAPQDNAQNHQAYDACAELWEIEADDATKDISRLCFTSHDPRLYVNPEAWPLEVEYRIRPKRERVPGETIETLPDGKKYRTLRSVGGALRHLGLSAEMINTALQALRETHGETPGEAEPIEKLSKWLGEQEPELDLKTFLATLDKQRVLPGDETRFTPPSYTQLSQSHNGAVSGPESSFSSKSPVTKPLQKDTKPRRGLSIVTGDDFMRVKFPPIQWVVKNVIPEGLTMLAGKPKTGKSFLAVNIAVAVACGGRAIGSLKVDPGRVLYINMDSGQREFQTRFSAFERIGDLDLSFSCSRLDEGGMDEIADYVDTRDDVRLIVIDTFKHVRPPDNPKHRLYDQDYESLMGLADLARARNGLGIMVIHHANKLRDTDDPFDMISGSTGLTAALDTGIVLRQMAEGTAMYVKGKEMPPTDIALEWDNRLSTWCYAGPADAFNLHETQQAVIDAVRVGNTSPRDVADFTGLDYANVRQAMVRMAAGGQLQKKGRGVYDLSPMRMLSDATRNRPIVTGEEAPF